MCAGRPVQPVQSLDLLMAPAPGPLYICDEIVGSRSSLSDSQSGLPHDSGRHWGRGGVEASSGMVDGCDGMA